MYLTSSNTHLITNFKSHRSQSRRNLILKGDKCTYKIDFEIVEYNAMKVKQIASSILLITLQITTSTVDESLKKQICIIINMNTRKLFFSLLLKLFNRVHLRIYHHNELQISWKSPVRLEHLIIIIYTVFPKWFSETRLWYKLGGTLTSLHAENWATNIQKSWHIFQSKQWNVQLQAYFDNPAYKLSSSFDSIEPYV